MYFLMKRGGDAEHQKETNLERKSKWWEEIEQQNKSHSPYSLDLTSNDYRLSPKSKEHGRNKRLMFAVEQLFAEVRKRLILSSKLVKYCNTNGTNKLMLTRIRLKNKNAF